MISDGETGANIYLVLEVAELRFNVFATGHQ